MVVHRTSFTAGVAVLVAALALSFANAQTLVAGNPRCQDLGYTYGAKYDPPTQGTYSTTYGTITFTHNGTYLDWSSTFGISAVIMKGGPNANVYSYSPPSFGDTGLHSPFVPSGAPAGLSHVEFCYEAPTVLEATLVVNKTGAGLFDRTVTWDLDKSVLPTSHTGLAGMLAGSSIWTIDFNKLEVLGNYRVAGTVTVTNPSPGTVTFALADSLRNAGDAVVDSPTVMCPGQPAGTGVVGPLASVTCAYEATLLDASAVLNRVVVEVTNVVYGGPEILLVYGNTASTSIGWSEQLFGDDQVLLTDPRVGYSNTWATSGTLTVPEDFLCSSDENDYTAGAYGYDALNIAYLSGANTDLQASASVRVDCTLPALQVEQLVAASFDHTVMWELTKSVDPAMHSGLAGQSFGSTWTMGVVKSSIDANFFISGTITITNPSMISQAFLLADALDDGTPVTLDCPSYVVPALGTVICTYFATPMDASATLNTATVTTSGGGVLTASSLVAFVQNTIGFEEGLLTDPYLGLSTLVSGSTTLTIPDTFTCSTNAMDYTAGSYSFTVPNTVYLNSGINLEASAQVVVDCTMPVRPGRPSLEVENVTIATAARGSNLTSGTFTIRNVSSGTTYVTLGDVWMTYFSRLPRGIRIDHTASCEFTPQAIGYTLAPDEAATFAYSCTINPMVAANANELTARVHVSGATNQAGEVRDRTFVNNSSPYFF